jgi:hypothetical protein
MKKTFLHIIQNAPRGFLQGKKSHAQLSIIMYLNQYLIDSFYNSLEIWVIISNMHFYSLNR